MAFRLEAQCAFLLEQRNSSFIQGSEGAQVDCGLLDIEPSPLFDDKTHQLFEILQRYRGRGLLIPLDVKSVAPLFSLPHRGGLLYYMISTTQTQSDVFATYVVFSGMNPNIVALIPHYYLAKIKSSGVDFIGREVPLNCIDPPSFALEWMPFVMPLSFLSRALDSLLAFSRGRDEFW